MPPLASRATISTPFSSRKDSMPSWPTTEGIGRREVKVSTPSTTDSSRYSPLIA